GLLRGLGLDGRADTTALGRALERGRLALSLDLPAPLPEQLVNRWQNDHSLFLSPRHLARRSLAARPLTPLWCLRALDLRVASRRLTRAVALMRSHSRVCTHDKPSPGPSVAGQGANKP